MHCAICDKDDDSVNEYNSDCSECQGIIYDTVTSYDMTIEVVETNELADLDIVDVGC